jgi:hypothetical protein
MADEDDLVPHSAADALGRGGLGPDRRVEDILAARRFRVSLGRIGSRVSVGVTTAIPGSVPE